MAVAALIMSIVGLAIAGLSAYFSRRQVSEARKANALPTAAAFLAEYRDLEPDRRFIYRDLPRLVDPHVEIPISELPDPARQHVRNVAQYLDHVGVLVHNDLLDLDFVAGYLGKSITQTWGAIGKYIRAERNRSGRGPYYDVYFEDLVARIDAIPADTLYKNLRKVSEEDASTEPPEAAASDATADIAPAETSAPAHEEA